MILQVLVVEAPFQIRAGVDARRRVPLEEDDVAVAVVAPLEEMVEADFVERGRRGVGRNVAADPFIRLVRAHDHGGRVPADEALDAALHVGAARHQHLFVGRNRVDVRGIGGERKLHAGLARMDGQLAQQPDHLARAAALQDIIERVAPFPGLDGLELRGVFGGYVSHGIRILSTSANHSL
jgi:hypothetical protein